LSLTKYRQKRHFGQTPEPQGGDSAASGDLRFVIQKHQASHLHYDFRLELDGVLKSWAVPKGPSTNPNEKRLAMMVEDHPIDYGDFEGIIPPGNYGAGSVIVWDRGTYRARDAATRKQSEQMVAEGLKRGHLKFVMEGEKLRGEFALLKLKKGEKNAWLLVKKRDEHADGDAIDHDHSVLSGRTLADVAAGVSAKGKRTVAKPKKSPRRATPAPKSTSFVKPMLATLVDKPFDRDGWLFEVKWDGYRAIAEVNDGEVRLYSRNEQSFNTTFAPVAEGLKELGHDAILDGEIVALDRDGISQFQLLQNYRRTGKGQLVYYVFDLLECDGEDLRSKPLRQRKKRLTTLIGGFKNVLLSEHVEQTGIAFFEAASERGLEGVVAKNASSPYREGVRNNDWLKIKTHQRQEAVIAGYTRPKGSRQHIGSLVLGVYEGGKLTYIGHTGTGFDTRGLADMYQRLQELRRDSTPFEMEPKTNTPAQWLEPNLVCEVNFQGWTDSGRMRHPVFVGLREDKAARSVHREQAKDAVQATTPSKRPRARIATPSTTPSTNAPKLTNLTKVYWPEDGYTKGDLIEYYREVASTILPYLKDRPMSLNRHPNGINKPNFYQKDVSQQPPPDWVETVQIKLESEKRTLLAPLCQNEETLLYLANLGCIEMNPWNSRTTSLDRPDYLVIDLDPEAIAFSAVVEAALAVRKVLEKASADCFCKTSGKTGLHIYIPLGARYDYEPARQFGELIANLVNAELPETTSVVRRPVLRQGKVYLDYLQNSRGQTLASAYSVRPYAGATVSTPLKWSEVSRRLDPSRFTIRTVLKRLEKIGDLWKPAIGKGIDLARCVERLSV
jgi:bifunctional non-homologous end joining protein LigD